jgi:hypothetical protein
VSMDGDSRMKIYSFHFRFDLDQNARSGKNEKKR